MERKKCLWALNPEKKHGSIPLKHRFVADSVGMNVDDRSTTLNDVGLGYCFIKGAKGYNSSYLSSKR